MKKQTLGFGVMAWLLAGSPGRGEAADWAVLVDNGSNIRLTSARVLVAPKTSENRLIIHRIRMTRSGATAFQHTFVANVSEDAVGETRDLTSCSAPGCKQLVVVPGVSQKEIIDLDNLELRLTPNARLHYFADQDAGFSHVTIEVFYTESP